MKKDVYNHEGRYKTWKEDAVLYGIDGLTKENSDMVLRYLIDMETGTNISIKNKKGARSYPRLNNLKQRMRQLLILLQNRGVTNIIQVTDSQITRYSTICALAQSLPKMEKHIVPQETTQKYSPPFGIGG